MLVDFGLLLQIRSFSRSLIKRERTRQRDDHVWVNNQDYVERRHGYV